MGIAVAQFENGTVISHRKYVLNILEEIELRNSKPLDTHMDPNAKLLQFMEATFTKPLLGQRIDYIYNKFDAYDLYVLAWGGVLNVFNYANLYMCNVHSIYNKFLSCAWDTQDFHHMTLSLTPTTSEVGSTVLSI